MPRNDSNVFSQIPKTQRQITWLDNFNHFVRNLKVIDIQLVDPLLELINREWNIGSWLSTQPL